MHRPRGEGDGRLPRPAVLVLALSACALLAWSAGGVGGSGGGVSRAASRKLGSDASLREGGVPSLASSLATYLPDSLTGRGGAWQEDPDSLYPHVPGCKLYVLEPETDLGMPGCDWSKPQYWRFNNRKSKLEASGALQHYEYQHAVQHWVAAAIRDSPYAVRSASEAQLTFVNLHCYSAWHVSVWWKGVTTGNPRSDSQYKETGTPDALTIEAMRKVRELEVWKSSNGTRIAVAPFWPGYHSTMLREVRPCDAQPFVITSEHNMFCRGNAAAAQRGDGLLIPHVALKHQDDLESPAAGAAGAGNATASAASAPRDIFMFYRGSCASLKGVPSNRSAGKLMRAHFMASAPVPQPPDVDMQCSCALCGNAMAHAETIARMRRAVFCPVLPGDTQSSRRLAEVLLAGCIPVFVGAPFHTLSMPRDVDYASLAVFIAVHDRPWIHTGGEMLSPTNSPEMLAKWALDANLPPHTIVHVGRIADVSAHLRSIPRAVIDAKLAEVRRQRFRLFYKPAPGERRSQLGQAIVHRMCQYAASLDH